MALGGAANEEHDTVAIGPTSGAETSLELLIDGRIEIIGCEANTTILAALLRARRREVPSGCHGGGCGVCKIRILDGSYRCLTLSRDHVSEHEQLAGYSLACRTYPEARVKFEAVGSLGKVLKKRYGLF